MTKYNPPETDSVILILSNMGIPQGVIINILHMSQKDLWGKHFKTMTRNADKEYHIIQRQGRWVRKKL